MSYVEYASTQHYITLLLPLLAVLLMRIGSKKEKKLLMVMATLVFAAHAVLMQFPGAVDLFPWQKFGADELLNFMVHIAPIVAALMYLIYTATSGKKKAVVADLAPAAAEPAAETAASVPAETVKKKKKSNKRLWLLRLVTAATCVMLLMFFVQFSDYELRMQLNRRYYSEDDLMYSALFSACKLILALMTALLMKKDNAKGARITAVLIPAVNLLTCMIGGSFGFHALVNILLWTVLAVYVFMGMPRMNRACFFASLVLGALNAVYCMQADGRYTLLVALAMINICLSFIPAAILYLFLPTKEEMRAAKEARAEAERKRLEERAAKRRQSVCSDYHLYTEEINRLVKRSIFTLGIFLNFGWMRSMVRNARTVLGESTEEITGEWLCLWLPIYPLYWFYTREKRILKAARAAGHQMEDQSLVYLLLSLLGLNIICMCLMQETFNKLASGEMLEDAAEEAAAEAPAEAQA